MSLNSYLKDRKTRRLTELLLEHAGLCKSVGKSIFDVGKLLVSGNKQDLPSRVSIIKTQERSADEIELKINKEVAISNIPSKLGEELLLFVRTLDRAAGACKRSVINLEIIKDYSLPLSFTEKLMQASEFTYEIFVKMEEALNSMDNINTIEKLSAEINRLETKIDDLYAELKSGYFEIEESFKSSAALIILDHALRDLESSADFSEDAAEMLVTLLTRR